MLGVLSDFIPEGERLITIEDAAELRLAKPHVVALEARPANVEGAWRGDGARPGPQRAPDASRPHHRRRGSRR